MRPDLDDLLHIDLVERRQIRRRLLRLNQTLGRIPAYRGHLSTLGATTRHPLHRSSRRRSINNLRSRLGFGLDLRRLWRRFFGRRRSIGIQRRNRLAYRNLLVLAGEYLQLAGAGRWNLQDRLVRLQLEQNITLCHHVAAVLDPRDNNTARYRFADRRHVNFNLHIRLPLLLPAFHLLSSEIPNASAMSQSCARRYCLNEPPALDAPSPRPQYFRSICGKRCENRSCI